MKTFTVVWTESRSMGVEAESKEEAREKFLSGDLDYSIADCNSSEIDEVYEEEDFK